MTEVCEICSKVFKNKNSLGFHKRKYHSEQGVGIKLNSFGKTRGDNHSKPDDDDDDDDDVSSDDNVNDGLSLGKDVKSICDNNAGKKILGKSKHESSDDNASIIASGLQGGHRDKIQRRKSSIGSSSDENSIVNQVSSQYNNRGSKKRNISLNPNSKRDNKIIKTTENEIATRQQLRDDYINRERVRQKQKLLSHQTLSTDEESDNVTYNSNSGVNDLENAESSGDNSNINDPSHYVNCVSIRYFEKVRRYIIIIINN